MQNNSKGMIDLKLNSAYRLLVLWSLASILSVMLDIIDKTKILTPSASKLLQRQNSCYGKPFFL